MKYAPSAWNTERALWRPVIQLNLLHSIFRILDALQAEMDNEHLKSDTNEIIEIDDPICEPLVFSEKYHALKLRLEPLYEVERDLKRILGAEAEEVQLMDGPMHASPFDAEYTPARESSQGHRPDEFNVRSLTDAIARTTLSVTGDNQSANQEGPVGEQTEIIARYKDDMEALWADSTIRKMLRRRKINIEESAGLYVNVPGDFALCMTLIAISVLYSFLDDLDHVATPFYEPSDEHILRARLPTLGVQEFEMTIDEPVISGNHFPLYIYETYKTCMLTSGLFVDRKYDRKWTIQCIDGARTSVRLLYILAVISI
jgi:guanine nucleotide-binding protein alpha-1 subunit